MFRPSHALFYDFHTSPNYPDLGKYFNAGDFADFLVECGIDFLTFHARCNMGNAYYNTRIGIRHPSLTFDLFGALAEECARRGIALNAYFNGGLSQAEAVQHPDWQTVPPRPFSGEVSPLARRMCYNSPYHEHLVAMIEEVARNYPVAGFFIDCMQPNPCHCERCSADMRSAGLDPSSAEDMTAFSRQAALRLADDIAAAARKYIAEPLLYFNCIDYEDQRDSGSYLECECIPSRSDWGYEYLPVVGRYMRTLGNKPCLNMTARFYSWGDFGGLRTSAALRHELLFGMANGLRPNIGDHFPPDGVLTPAVRERIRKVYSSIHSCDSLFEGAKPFAEAAVVYPKPLSNIRTDGELRGAARLLSELDIQFDIVTAASDWSGYSLLILPDCIRLDPEIRRRLERHLKAGGKIISSGHSGLTDDGQFPPEWPVSCLGEAPWDPVFFYCPEILPDMPFALHAPGILVRPAAETKIFGRLQKAYHNREWFNGYPEFYLPPEKDPVGPFLVMNRQVAHFSHGIFLSHHCYAASEIRTMLDFAIRQIFPEPKLRIAGRPTFLRSILGTKDHADILHLFAVVPEQKGTETQVIEDEITVCGLTVQLRCDGRRVKKVFMPAGELPFTIADGRVCFTIGSMQGYLPVTIEYY